VQTIKMVNHPRAGILPDFGNVRISCPSLGNPTAKVESYDSSVGVAELMPFARGVSVKPWDFHGNSSEVDLLKIMKDRRRRGLSRALRHRIRSGRE
jgi:hypothetical protein